MIALPPFDHPDVIAGQGTPGLEMLEELPEAETLLVPLSGGGPIAGIAMAAKTLTPSVRLIGVSMQRGAAMHERLQADHPVPVKEQPTRADFPGQIGIAPCNERRRQDR